MSEPIHRRIADLFPRRSHRIYSRTKLDTDPLYLAIHRELEGSDHPLLDLGCGLGLLAFYLRENGHSFPIHAVDYDDRKISTARKASTYPDVTFAHHDARASLPEHAGSVTILDILQFFTPAEQETILTRAASRTVPDAKLLIRSAVRDASWRYRFTFVGDIFARLTFWMKAAPTHYPTVEDFTRILSPFGKVTITPLWGGTPFNNHLIVLQRKKSDVVAV